MKAQFFSLLFIALFAANSFASTARIACDWSESQQRYVGPSSRYAAALNLDRHCQSWGYAGAVVQEMGECHRDAWSLGYYVVMNVRYGCAMEVWR